MSKLLKFERPNKIYDLTIDYMLTFRCNYDCSYCISHDINHPLHKHSAETISNSLNYLHDLYDNKKTRLKFLGGEPFLYKNFGLMGVALSSFASLLVRYLALNILHKRLIS